ncbi:MAG: hypothetical protein QOE23_289 [Pseudonocardiales bacterium]|jgi:hypothetical protein|nr:hypothetical protein [Pseudonocardiales bacterium]
MPFSVAAAILLGLLGLVNLALLLGVIRRLNDHTAVLARLAGEQPRVQSALPPGQRPATFRATTMQGEQVAGQELALVAFLSQDCRRCQERLPAFVEAAKAMPEGRRQVLAVVVAGPEVTHPDNPANSHLTRLSEVAQVVVEQLDGPIASAFQVAGFPSFCRLGSDGIVVANGDAALTAA